ncbi:flagellin lysine-N-methylase [Bacillus suaedae]|uniref:Flagellin lysine-N-methylase n=1 Tax=Halalkalibacter suaedae TaxID=2822140 RepID=A0A940WY22_9BACI|nr:flagellin lysine-N-methylase [Bacillus suaedae]MBP3950034.1 flagellin lysine-N-methylase [Bacillus suaedae]
MTTRLVEALIPEYIKSFSCIGSACEDTCCAGWTVNIDKETYNKYKKVKQPTMKSRFKDNLVKNRSNPTNTNAAKMKMNQGNCSFLSREGLCDIYNNLGEDYLSNTCAIYPRKNRIVNQIFEQSLTVSCPEATRLILLNKDGIKFEQGFQELKIRSLVSLLPEFKGEIKDWKDYFNEYRYITISILQDRRYTLEERLLILGLFYNELQECINKNNLKDIPNILGEYLKCVEDETFLGAFTEISKRKDIHLRLCKELVILGLNQTVTSKRYLECLKDMIAGLKIEDISSDEDTQKLYENSYEKYYLPFMKENEYIIENLLVNYVFKDCMPINGDSPFDSYSIMIINYALIKIHLVGMASHRNEITIEMVIKLVQSLSKTFEHDPKYYDSIINLLKEKDMMTLAYLSILVNN